MLIHQNTNVMNKKHTKMTDFFAQAQGLINGLNEGGQYGTAQNYSKSCSSLKAFIADTEGGPDGTLYVEEMDDRIIARNNHYLSERGVIRNTASFYNRTLRAIYNRKLKALTSQTKENMCLTSYVSRHSWATAARNSRVGMSIISEGLGHTSERTTRIYLGSFDSRLIDNANKRLVDGVNKNQ